MNNRKMQKLWGAFRSLSVSSSTKHDGPLLSDEDVNFDHFQILRAIGKGSFGKVCIVQKRDTGRLFAMKYVSRSACVGRGALGGVLKEVELLSSLEHPFLVNLWFSFQDEEDLFMVCDLLAGGDLRYHLQQQTEFSLESVLLLVCELGSALDYLQYKRVIHRDVKPDNILLDEDGHAHLTDFNIATRLHPDSLACSMSGTKPYMAPEVFLCALEEVAGYSYPVDWWSLGVVAYEMRAGIRPFVVHSNTPLAEVKNTLHTPLHFPRHWSEDFMDLISKLLHIHPGARISSQGELQQTALIRGFNFDEVLSKSSPPPFRPPKDHLNCDPSLELEEMIVEAKPLHKKKKRLAKQRSIQRESDVESSFIKEFLVYNRYKEVRRREMEQKELDWEQELNNAMANSEVSAGSGNVNLRTVEEDCSESNGGGELSQGKTHAAVKLSDMRDNWSTTEEVGENSCVTAGSSSVVDAGLGARVGSEEPEGNSAQRVVIVASSSEKRDSGSAGGGIIDFIDRTPSPKPSNA